MEISFVAGFGPIPTAVDASVDFWGGAVGLSLQQVAPDYYHAELPGMRVFAIWPLSQASEATFGVPEWPADRPVPQAWLELDVASHEAVAPALEELRQRGCEVLREAHLEPWGQTTGRVQSPEGLLVGISHTPWLHTDEEPTTDS